MSTQLIAGNDRDSENAVDGRATAPGKPVGGGRNFGNGTGRKARDNRETTLTSRLVVTIVLGCFAIYFLVPIWWLVVAASKPMGEQFSAPGFWFNGMHMGSNVAELLSSRDGIFMRWILNSIFYAGIGAIVGTLLASMAGYALAKYRFRGREVVFGVVLAAVLIPKILFTLPLYLMFSEVGLINNPLAVILPSIVSPFGVYLSRVFAAQSVPDEVIEAARLDGLGEVGIYFRIGLRMMTPALVTIFLFNFVEIWNNYLLPAMVINDSSLQPVTVGLVSWFASNGKVPMSLVVVGALVSIIPLLLLFLFLQRFWKAGLTAGAVK
ncbi:carbohydrate ABC transporter permease [Paeniglutamicibacter kerguelensis]|uniref:Multiple sugar transport system permease protein n=1 Tax=Paeniglutamicibacter kerguelensis TaxID=254788 RepID=A0ABS4XEW7_9MICC|nr:carbohydrate ABC transporter permease [Paeniglutamicibacter kerguelensis]MBP2387017.1 multiple sugar transport system permease protein [Paeniglutamicibacter kerguelensis]